MVWLRLNVQNLSSFCLLPNVGRCYTTECRTAKKNKQNFITQQSILFPVICHFMCVNSLTSPAAARGWSGQALNVKANSRSNKCDLIIIYLVSCSVRAWLRFTRSRARRSSGSSKAFIVLLTLFVKMGARAWKGSAGILLCSEQTGDNWKLFGCWEGASAVIMNKNTVNKKKGKQALKYIIFSWSRKVLFNITQQRKRDHTQTLTDYFDITFWWIMSAQQMSQIFSSPKRIIIPIIPSFFLI